MYILTLGLQKGGTGKTTSCMALAQGMTRRGIRVLTMDLDPQGSLTVATGATRGGRNVYDCLTGRARVEDAIQSTPRGDIVPSSPRLGGLETDLPRTGRENRLRDSLDGAGLPYDVVIMDTPPGASLPLMNALTASDGLIMVTQTDAFSIQGLDAMDKMVADVRKYTNPKLETLGVMVTRYNGRGNINSAVMGMIEGRAPAMSCVVYPPVRECIAVREAYAMGADLWEYAPRSNAVKDYDAVIDILSKQIGMTVPSRRKRKVRRGGGRVGFPTVGYRGKIEFYTAYKKKRVQNYPRNPRFWNAH